MKQNYKTWENTKDTRDKMRNLITQLNKITGTRNNSSKLNSTDQCCNYIFISFLAQNSKIEEIEKERKRLERETKDFSTTQKDALEVITHYENKKKKLMYLMGVAGLITVLNFILILYPLVLMGCNL